MNNRAWPLAGLAALTLCACGGGKPAPRASGFFSYTPLPTAATASPALTAPPAAGTSVPLASPITAVPPATASPADVLASAAGQYRPVRRVGNLAGIVPKDVGMRFGDPVAAARAYTETRWTFHSADSATYTLALEAPGITTPAFQARSAPTAMALAQGKNSNDVSTATVTAAGISAEAPRTTVLAYVSVAYTVTDSYTGAVNPRPESHVWSLRVTRTSPTAGWHVDGVAQDG